MTPNQLAQDLRRPVRLIAPPAVQRAVGLIGVADMKRRVYAGRDVTGAPFKPLARPRPDGSARPLLDTGVMVNSVSHRPTATGGVEWTAGAPQSALMHFGGTVAPKRGTYLAIPVTRAARRQTARRFPGKLRGVYGKKGGVLLDRRGAVQYVLAKSVTVPPRPWFGIGPDGWREIDELVLGLAADGVLPAGAGVVRGG